MQRFVRQRYHAGRDGHRGAKTRCIIVVHRSKEKKRQRGVLRVYGGKVGGGGGGNGRSDKYTGWSGTTSLTTPHHMSFVPLSPGSAVTSSTIVVVDVMMTYTHVGRLIACDARDNIR